MRTTLLLALLCSPLFAAGPAGRDLLTAPQKQRLALASRLLGASAKLLREGKTADGHKALVGALLVQREVLGAMKAELAAPVSKLAALLEREGHWDVVALLRRELVFSCRSRFGRGALETFDAELNFDEAARMAKWPGAMRAKWRKARATLREAEGLKGRGKPREALPRAREAVEALQALVGEGHPRCVLARNLCGLLLKELADYRAAERVYGEALGHARKGGGEKHRLVAVVLYNIAALHRTMGRLDDSEREFRASLAINTALGETGLTVADGWFGLAGVMSRRGKAEEARRLYEQALRAYRGEAGEKSHRYTSCLHEIAVLDFADEKLREAEGKFRRVLALRREARGANHPSCIGPLNNLSAVYRRRNDYRAAREAAFAAYQIAEAAYGGKHPKVADAMVRVGQVYRDTDDPTSALLYYQAAYKMRRDTLGLKHEDTLSAGGNVAGVAEQIGDNKLALELRQLLVRIRKGVQGPRHPDVAGALSNLGATQGDAGRLKEARASLEEALVIYREAGRKKGHKLATTLGSLAGVAYREGKKEEALGVIRRALEAMKNAPVPGRLEAATRGDYAVLLAELGKKKEALEQARLAEAQGRERSASALATQSDRRQLAIQQAWRHHLDLVLSLDDDAGRTYNLVLGWKGQANASQQRRRQLVRLAREGNPNLREAVKELQQVTRAMAAASLGEGAGKSKAGQLRVLGVRKDALEAQLLRLAPGKLGLPDASGEALARALPRGHVLVDYLVYSRGEFRPGKAVRVEQCVAAWVVLPGKPVVRVELGPLGPIDDAITAWRRELMRGRRGGEATRRLVWAPVEKYLAGDETALVSPDGAMGRVPWAALPGRKKGTYLLEERAVVVVPVPRLLVEKERKAGPEGKGLLLAGGVDFGKKEYPPLPATRLEALAVQGLFKEAFPGKPSTLLEGRKAGAKEVAGRLAEARFAHLAVHGYFAAPAVTKALARYSPGPLFGRGGLSSWQPNLLAGLVLARGDLLTALEVSELDLAGVELAVLSACETGLGKEAAGEGLLGLQRAFQVGGCKRVVASLWSVDDAATAVLMERFYHHLWGKKKLPDAEALRQAQLDVLRHPEWVQARARSLRGVGRVAEKLPAGVSMKRSPPVWWAAFQLAR